MAWIVAYIINGWLGVWQLWLTLMAVSLLPVLMLFPMSWCAIMEADIWPIRKNGRWA